MALLVPSFPIRMLINTINLPPENLLDYQEANTGHTIHKVEE